MLALGDRMAQGLGVSLLKTRLLALLAIALLCGAAVSVAGPIGFIGLVVPQLIRRLVSVDLRVMVPLLSPLRGAGSAAGGHRRPNAVYALGAGNRRHDCPGRRARLYPSWLSRMFK